MVKEPKAQKQEARPDAFQCMAEAPHQACRDQKKDRQNQDQEHAQN